MSNIPKARALLKEALEGEKTYGEFRDMVREVLPLLDRKRPEFKVTVARMPPLTYRQKQTCRRMRDSGMPVHEIAVRMCKNQGSVSLALSETA